MNSRTVPRNVSLCDCLYLCQILTDFQNFFHWCILLTISNIVIIEYPTTRWLCCYTTLWSINARKTNNNRQQALLVNKIHFQPKITEKCSEWSVWCTLCYIRFFGYLAYWVIRLFLDLWFSKPTISSTVATFSSVHVCFSLPVSCLWSVLHVSQISVSNNPTLYLLQVIFKNSASILRKLYLLNQYKFLIRALSPLLNGALHHRCIKNYYLLQYHLLSFTNIRNACKTRYNLMYEN